MPGNQLVMYTYKGWNQEQIDRHDHYLHDRLPDCDTFFVSSMAAQAGKAERTLRNYLRTDATLGFIHHCEDGHLRCADLEPGEFGTNSYSMQAWAQTHRENDGRHKIETGQTNFIREVRVTDVSSGSVLLGGMMGNDNEKK